MAGRVTCSAVIGTSVPSAAASTTGTSLYSHGCRSITWPSGKSCVMCVSKMPKWVRESSAVSGPACPATHSTLPTFSSQSCASWLNRRIGPYFRYENEPYVEVVPQKPLKSLNGSAAMLTVARPTVRPALPNSVIWVGRTVPCEVGVALVPAPARHVAEVLPEAGEVGRFGEVSRGTDEQRSPIFLLGEGIHVGAPRAVRGSVGLLIAGLLPDLVGVGVSVEQALVLEDGAAVGQVEAVDLVGNGRGDLDQAVGQPIGELGSRPENGQRRFEVGARLRLALARVRGDCLVDALVLDAVLRHEVLADGPELGRVHRPRRAVALGVVLAVAAALARLEPRHGRRFVRVVAARRLEHRPSHRWPLRALLRPVHAPAVAVEPRLRRAVDDGRQADARRCRSRSSRS